MPKMRLKHERTHADNGPNSRCFAVSAAESAQIADGRSLNGRRMNGECTAWQNVVGVNARGNDGERVRRDAAAESRVDTASLMTSRWCGAALWPPTTSDNNRLVHIPNKSCRRWLSAAAAMRRPSSNDRKTERRENKCITLTACHTKSSTIFKTIFYTRKITTTQLIPSNETTSCYTKQLTFSYRLPVQTVHCNAMKFRSSIDENIFRMGFDMKHLIFPV